MKTSMSGVEMIAKERKRQIDREGFTPEHDDDHGDGELAAAASCYARFARMQAIGDYERRIIRAVCEEAWPWGLDSFRPASEIKNLVRAGALIAAEIDRLQRQRENQGNPIAQYCDMCGKVTDHALAMCPGLSGEQL